MSTGPSWLAAEPELLAFRREMGRLFRRARRSRAVVLGLAALITAGAVAVAFRAPHNHRAQIAVRVSEVIDPELPRSIWRERELRGYVTEVAFTDEVLLTVFQKYLHDPGKPLVPARAIERLREDVEVKVLQSRTVAEVQGRTAPRSAHVLIAFAAPTAAQAEGVVRALAQPVMSTSARLRRDEATQEVRRARLAAEEARLRVVGLTKYAIAAVGTLGRLPRGVSPLQLTGLENAMRIARESLKDLEDASQQAERRQRSEAKRPGIDLEIASESIEHPFPLPAVLAAIALLAFLVGLPLAALLVGAFDSRLQIEEDIARLGVPVLGRMPGVVQRS